MPTNKAADAAARKATARALANAKKGQARAIASANKDNKKYYNKKVAVLKKQKKSLEAFAGIGNDTVRARREALVKALEWLVDYAKKYGTYKDRTGMLRGTIYYTINVKKNTGRVIAPMRYAGFVESETNSNRDPYYWVISGAMKAGSRMISPVLSHALTDAEWSYSDEKDTPFDISFTIHGLETKSRSQISRLSLMRK